MKNDFVWSRPVEFYETDSAGMVHFSNFYRWMEAAEHAFLRERGVSLDEGELGWPRVHASADFQKPIRFGDTVRVRVKIAERGTRSLRYAFEIGVAGSEEVHGTGEMVSVCLDLKTMKGIEIPAELRARLA